MTSLNSHIKVSGHRSLIRWKGSWTSRGGLDVRKSLTICAQLYHLFRIQLRIQILHLVNQSQTYKLGVRGNLR